ncbi:PqqD family protein [uncultured Sphingomonas sp.]|uniref:PqqD family protein n=1 Tax=uncultured Sphingomonas sp. TaxID=158754 RepID=UPI0025F61080|nr:PqqD family protein [uncultured Sphingomonas sp.]
MNGRDVIARNADLLTTQVDDELLAMDIAQGECFGLNPVGTAIWNLLAEPRTVDALCDELLARFEVTEDACRAQLSCFLAEMQDAMMIAVTRGD